MGNLKDIFEDIDFVYNGNMKKYIYSKFTIHFGYKHVK